MKPLGPASRLYRPPQMADVKARWPRHRQVGVDLDNLYRVAIAEGSAMAITDKLDRLNERHAEFEQKLDADADKLLAKYDELDAKKDKVFDRRLSALAERDKALDKVDEALDRMSNLGNSPGS